MKIRSITVLGIAVFSAIPVWLFVVFPRLFLLPSDFVYEAEISSVDNFYDEAKGEFLGEQRSVTKFSYNVESSVDNVLTIKNIFDVSTLAGDPIFSVERMYGVDRRTGRHVSGHGDKNRDGYLFAPRNLKKGEPFTYWHINYDGPARMTFAGEETISGLNVYRYESRYEGIDIDQTKNLTYLPGVGVTRGINLDPYLQTWIEPTTGRMIKYKDETAAYFYDLATKERLFPWNKFSNTYANSSIIAQVEVAKQQKLHLFTVKAGMLAGIILFGLIALLFGSRHSLVKTKSTVEKFLKDIEIERNKAKESATMIAVQNAQLAESLKIVEEAQRNSQITLTESEKAKKALSNVLEDIEKDRELLAKEKAKDDAMLQSIGDGLIVTDENGNIVRVNKTTFFFLGKEATDVIGQWIIKAVELLDRKTEKTISSEERPITRALESGKPETGRYLIRKPDKSLVAISLTVSPILLNDIPIGTIQVFKDVTQEEMVDKAKTEFVSLASHQLRTPLTSINWYAEMLLAGDAGKLNKTQKKYLDQIYHGNQRMVDLVNTLLNVSRLELGTLMIEPTPVNMRDLAHSVMDEQKPTIDERKLVLKPSFADNVPVISADPKLLRMVLQNLLSNAVKYTPEGGTIEFALSADKNNITVKVADTGYGIPKSQQDKIFSKLFRADNVRAKDTEGTGLGLYIVKLIVENSGGKIWFESEEDKGTVFYVTLPLAGMQKKEGTKTLA